MTLSSTQLAPLRATVDFVRASLRRISPAARALDAKVRGARARTDACLRDMCGTPAGPFDGEVLIDSQWDNPNYWLRTCLLRAAIGLPNGRETAILGKFNRQACRSTLNTLGIGRHVVHHEIEIDAAAIRRDAAALVARTRTAADVLEWKLPGDVPAALIYDGILKRQRLASVSVTRGDFAPLVREALAGIARAQALLDAHDFKLVVISHPLNFTYGVIADQALRRGIPVVLPFGLFGVSRMTHMRRPEDLFAFYDRPTGAEIAGLSPERAAALAEIGGAYLAGRFGGKADDLASVYAYRRNLEDIDRNSLCEKFGWDPAKPIVGFYASNWYDWPHQLGMTQFRDFLDWTEATFAVAAETSSVNWLFKPHPCEEWFGGVALRTILDGLGDVPHIRLSEGTWNNTAVMGCLDALVTYHGTAGIEFASLGKPVLVPDRGKYEDCGFVKVAADRADYLAQLRGEWWRDMNLAHIRRRAEIFAGWWFCAPDWQDGFVLADDSRQNALYDLIPGLLAEYPEAAAREVQSLREWFASGHMYSHTFKMKHADGFRLSNLA